LPGRGFYEIRGLAWSADQKKRLLGEQRYRREISAFFRTCGPEQKHLNIRDISARWG